MLRIGLTGAIGAGKSTAAAHFARLGATVVDHDVLARAVVEPGSAGLVDIVREFGDRVLNEGRLDRQALAAIVFEDPIARIRLNEIVHPYVRSAAEAADRRARADGTAVIVHDIPLLVETGQGDDFDLVVGISAPRETRLKRLQEGRGMSREQALARMQSQASDEQRNHVCDVVLDGGGSVDDLCSQIDAFWESHIPH